MLLCQVFLRRPGGLCIWSARLVNVRGVPLLQGPDHGIVPDASAQVDQRDELFRLLLQLPPGQRAAIVLRYWEDLSEAEAARVLGCSPGTVKSAASRGLARLRELGGTPPAAPACQEGTMQR
jgi:DNA-directed RNA polymerase specialized sigma24 family protein